MQVNRKYYLMLLLIAILITLALLGDSEIVNPQDSIYTDQMIMADSLAVNTENNTKTMSDNYTAEQLKEDTFITKSKTWIIEKESILGY